MHTPIQTPSIQVMLTPAIGAIRRILAVRRPLLISGVVLGWSINEFVSLAVVHHTGPELYGVLVAALSTGAAAANFALLRSPRMQGLATAALLVLWAVVAVGGIGGTIAHVVGPVPGYGPVDPRPRPITAPLVFTVLGSAGGLALVLGQRGRSRREAE